jgi:hypothetical protein
MIDLSTQTVRRLFEQQMKLLTQQTLMPKEDSFDYQFSGRWIQ